MTSEYRSVTAVPSTSVLHGRRRSEASRKAILDATYELLKAIGFHQMSIEGVASRAGAGEATIYRWWSSNGVLAVEPFMEAGPRSTTVRKTGTARADTERPMEKLSAAKPA